MKTRYKVLIWILIAAVSFLAGSWVTFQGIKPGAAPARKILHYVDPMNPAFKSDKPGIAPCGMPLEPVYADQGDTAAGHADPRSSIPPGTVRIAPEKQQLIGVKVMTVEKAPWNHTIRVLGRVAPDETRVYRMNVATDCWVEEAMPVTTGSLVKENELLATLSFFSLEYRTLVQNFFNLLNIGQAADLSALANNPAYTEQQKPKYSEPQLRQMRKAARYAGDITDTSQIEYFRKSLYNYGISPYQLAEMERTRVFPEVIEVRAPVEGFVLFRNVSPGVRHEKGADLFRIADLSRVWILADIFENEADYFKPGMRVRMELPYQKKTFYARVSPVLPQFDPATRTFKVRLVADNPSYDLRPDMFVNVEIPVSGPAAIVVPVDAVLDSGLRKTVFVERDKGFFEPRQVEAGRHLGDRVEIVRGLMPGEKIVVSGNFLIDSEARMQQAASGIVGKIGRDPVCGMNIDEDRTKAQGNVLEHKGKTYFFCEPQCREDFRREPERYLKASPTHRTMPITGSRDAAAGHPAHDRARAPKPSGAKKAPEAHDGMTMPAAKTPAAMPGMPADPPPTESKKEGMAIPSTAAPGMGPASSALPGQEGAPAGQMPQEAASIPEAPTGKIDPPAPASRTPWINPRLQRYRLPGATPGAGPQAGETSPPATGTPEVKR